MDNLLQRVRLALADSYAVEAEVGRGGMAVVYLGTDLRHERSVAIKILSPQLASAIGHERFLQEIRLAAGLSHPYILPLLDSGETKGLVYYTMPFVEGENLRERLVREPQLPIEDALRIAGEMAEALGHAHALGIVHRDVKPSNILLTREHAMLADFGVARAIDRGASEHLTGTGLSVGTPAYMSPQQGLADERVDGASDQYSLACVVYEMLAGRPPFAGPTPDAVLRHHVVDPPPPLRAVRPSAPEAIEEALARALSKSPDARFASMEAFAAALPIPRATAGTGFVAGRVGASPGRRAALVAGGGLVLAAVAFGLSVLARGASRGATGGPATGSADVARFALLPCSAPDAADSLLGRHVANDVTLRLGGFPSFGVTAYAQSEAWAMDQVVGGYAVSDSVPAALRRLGASTLGICSIRSVGDDSIEVDLQLHGAAGEFSSHSVRLARYTDRAADTDPLVVELAGLLCQGSTSCGSSFHPTEDLHALRYYLEADEYFLRDRFDEAEHYFGRAADEDPEFALARWRQADARRWQAAPALEGIDIQQLLERQGDRLGMRDSLLLWALVETPGPSAFARFETVLELLPGDAYAKLLYGDELLHRGSLWGIPLDSAETLISAAARLNPRFAAAWDHLVQLRIRLGMEQEAREAVERLLELASQAEDDNPLPLAMIWHHAWLERFDPTGADANRPRLQQNVDLLALVARLVRYGDLPRAQLELGTALIRHSEVTPDSPYWHSGTIARGLALASRGRPEAASAAFRSAAHISSAAALFADQWDVVPAALGLEGFPDDAAGAAVPGLVKVAADTLADPLHRARAAWALALSAAARDADTESPGDFDGWRSLVDSLAAADRRTEHLAGHLDALALAREMRWRDALEASRSLVAYDSAGNQDRPFARAAVYLHRGRWFEAAGDPDSAIAAWSWHLNTDLESISPRIVQAGEVDGAFGSHARLRIAGIASRTGGDLVERACVEAAEVVRRWPEAEPALARELSDARRIASACEP